MTTQLDKTIKRALAIKGRDYVIAISPEAVKVTLKGHRLGVELSWVDLISGEAALATALQASIGKLTEDKTSAPMAAKRLAKPAKKKTPGKSKR
jgi:hypothetical protein